MKKIFAILVFLLTLAFVNVNAQVLDNEVYYSYSFTVDTCTNAETINFTFPHAIEGLYYYEWQLVADSLSGSTAGTAYLKEGAGESTDYSNLTGKTITVNGVQTSEVLQGTVYGTRQRLAITSSGTQSTKYTVHVTFKAVNKYK